MLKYALTVGALLFAANTHAADAVPVAPPATAPAAAAPAATPAATPAPVAPKKAGSVARAQFTRAIRDREPTDNITALDTTEKNVYFFTELKDFDGQTVTHRWEWNGKPVHELAFNVGGVRWRVYSSVNLIPERTGTWKVTVVDSSGGTLSAATFNYETAKPAPQPVAAPSAPAAPAAR
jgi:hypothetical protein